MMLLGIYARHICANKELFSTYTPFKDEKKWFTLETQELQMFLVKAKS